MAATQIFKNLKGKIVTITGRFLRQVRIKIQDQNLHLESRSKSFRKSLRVTNILAEVVTVANM